jgi:hypothetical protein
VKSPAGASVAGDSVAGASVAAGAPQAVRMRVSTIARNRTLRIFFFSLKSMDTEQTTLILLFTLQVPPFHEQEVIVYTIINGNS